MPFKRLDHLVPVAARLRVRDRLLVRGVERRDLGRVRHPPRRSRRSRVATNPASRPRPLRARARAGRRVMLVDEHRRMSSSENPLRRSATSFHSPPRERAVVRLDQLALLDVLRVRLLLGDRRALRRGSTGDHRRRPRDPHRAPRGEFAAAGCSAFGAGVGAASSAAPCARPRARGAPGPSRLCGSYWPGAM